MKKTLAVMLSIGMALSLFGCQKGGAPESAADSSTAKETANQTEQT